MLGLNETPLRYLLLEASDIEPLMEKNSFKKGVGTDSLESFELARKWMSICENEHEHCCSIDPAVRPTRLLHIDSNNGTLRLCEGSEIPENVRYATLSHCWGGDVPGKLLKNNIGIWKTGILLKDVEKTFFDAAKIALELGLEFIWIDSFCIVQDSSEDWHNESIKMALVYGNSMCNIAATSSSNSSGGCFTPHHDNATEPVELVFGKNQGVPRDVEIISDGVEGELDLYEKEHVKDKKEQAESNDVKRQVNSDNEETEDELKLDQAKGDSSGGPDDEGSFYLSDIRHWSRRFQKQPLNQRAWVIQERLLSRRTLHYERGQLVWECNGLFASQRFPRGFGNDNIMYGTHAKPLRVPLNPSFRNSQEDEVPGQALREIWRPVVHSFTSTNITEPTDRLIALHGVGARIQSVCGWEYIAGMFVKNLQSQLCWAAVGDPYTARPGSTIAPSWSWVSANQPINMMPQWDVLESHRTGQGPKPKDLGEEYLCDIKGISRGTSPQEDSGHFSSAKLHVSGYLVSAEFLNPADVRSDAVKNWRAMFEKLKAAREQLSKVRPICTDFKFMEHNKTVLKRRAHPKYVPLVSGGVLITWDFLEELTPDTIHDLWFMPVYKVREYGSWVPATGYNIKTAIHGLLLQAGTMENGQRLFRRCGTFYEHRPWQEFWEHALSFPPIAGVDLVQKDKVPLPEKNDEGIFEKKFVKADAVWQYQITIC
ncbi:HET-domain-containing protein [Periconia macrospinosa]|uniref:HET-domain-containing protein n=1 Tax=Periconia macrospinosa TaxID=97972 RepID=A0A2V1DEM6_9PLEO|nr:HET-domain-containing protein [Periconia macrospinosa]